MIRPYEAKDLEQCLRIFREVGWMEGEDSDKETFESYASDSILDVVELNGEVEVLVLTRTGDMKYLQEVLPFAGVTGVVASRVARTQGWALKTTAQSIARNVSDGADVSLLGMFDQGYYDKLGFGTLPYHRVSTFNPAKLIVPKLNRTPVRLSKENAEEMHECRLRRMRTHGSCNLHGFGATACELTWEPKNFFGLGFRDASGTLTHFFCCKAKGEHGPYSVWLSAYETYDQFIELLSLLKSFSDQVHGVRMADPPNVQIQDFLDRPMTTHRERKGGEFDSAVLNMAWMQCRMNNIEACIARTSLCCEPFSFNLTVNDPIEQFLPKDSQWVGEGGDWIITFGHESSAVRGTNKKYPSATASINGLSRLWIGAATASALQAIGQFDGQSSLITHLDSTIRLPSPTVDWDF